MATPKTFKTIPSRVSTFFQVELSIQPDAEGGDYGFVQVVVKKMQENYYFTKLQFVRETVCIENLVKFVGLEQIDLSKTINLIREAVCASTQYKVSFNVLQDPKINSLDQGFAVVQRLIDDSNHSWFEFCGDLHSAVELDPAYN